MTLADLVDEYLGMHQAEPMAGMMIAAAALSLLLLALFASKYFIVGFPIRVGLAAWAWQSQA